jgi:hypothetical protein
LKEGERKIRRREERKICERRGRDVRKEREERDGALILEVLSRFSIFGCNFPLTKTTFSVD